MWSPSCLVTCVSVLDKAASPVCKTGPPLEVGTLTRVEGAARAAVCATAGAARGCDPQSGREGKVHPTAHLADPVVTCQCIWSYNFLSHPASPIYHQHVFRGIPVGLPAALSFLTRRQMIDLCDDTVSPIPQPRMPHSLHVCSQCIYPQLSPLLPVGSGESVSRFTSIESRRPRHSSSSRRAPISPVQPLVTTHVDES